MKNLMYLSLILLVFSCNVFNDKTEYFEKRYEEITLTPPEKLCLDFMELCNIADSNSELSKYTLKMKKRQYAIFFRSASEEHLKLVFDILIYKEVLKNKKKSIEDLQHYVYKIINSKSDKLDRIVIKSFDFALEYKAEQLRLESEYFDY
jgi:hypothetical protein